MTKIENIVSESCSSNLVFLRKNHLQKDQVAISPQKMTLNFENALFLSAHLKILATVGKKIAAQGWSVFQTFYSQGKATRGHRYWWTYGRTKKLENAIFFKIFKIPFNEWLEMV